MNGFRVLQAMPLFLIGCSQSQPAVTAPSIATESKEEKGQAGDDGLASAQTELKRFKATLSRKSPEELISAFVPDGQRQYGGHEYYFKFMVNDEIRAELKSRGSSAHTVLQAHLNDQTPLWEAINGPGDTIGRACQDVLEGR